MYFLDNGIRFADGKRPKRHREKEDFLWSWKSWKERNHRWCTHRWRTHGSALHRNLRYNPSSRLIKPAKHCQRCGCGTHTHTRLTHCQQRQHHHHHACIFYYTIPLKEKWRQAQPFPLLCFLVLKEGVVRKCARLRMLISLPARRRIQFTP